MHSIMEANRTRSVIFADLPELIFLGSFRGVHSCCCYYLDEMSRPRDPT